MKNYDLYGLQDASVDEARRAVEEALGIKFVAHESLYTGEYYLWGDVAGKNFVLQANYDPLEQEWTEEEFQEYEVLLYANEIEKPEELQRLLLDKVGNISLLRREHM